MLQKSVLALVAAGWLLAAAAFAPIALGTGPHYNAGHGARATVHGKLLQTCIDQPVECGLLAW